MKKELTIALCLIIAGCTSVRFSGIDYQMESRVVAQLKETVVACPDLCRWITITDKVEVIQTFIDDPAQPNTETGPLHPQLRLDVPQEYLASLPSQSVMTRNISVYDILTEIARQANLKIVIERNQVFLRYRKE